MLSTRCILALLINVGRATRLIQYSNIVTFNVDLLPSTMMLRKIGTRDSDGLLLADHTFVKVVKALQAVAL